MPEPEGPATPPPESPPSTRQQPHLPAHRQMLANGFLKRLAAGVAALFVAGYGAYAKFGAYWPTEPTIAPSGSPESPPDSPFAIQNESVIFPMKDVTFTCTLVKGTFKIGNENGWVMAFIATWPPEAWQRKSAGMPIEILPGKHANFICNTTGMVSGVQINHQPAQLRGMQVRMTVEYAVDFFGFIWHRHYDSDLFTCDLTDGKCHWLIGNIVY